jgi:hypothetical protein
MNNYCGKINLIRYDHVCRHCDIVIFFILYTFLFVGVGNMDGSGVVGISVPEHSHAYIVYIGQVKVCHLYVRCRQVDRSVPCIAVFEYMTGE